LKKTFYFLLGVFSIVLACCVLAGLIASRADPAYRLIWSLTMLGIGISWLFRWYKIKKKAENV